MRERANKEWVGRNGTKRLVVGDIYESQDRTIGSTHEHAHIFVL